MQSQTNTRNTVDRDKVAAIIILTLLSVAIIAVGISFCIYSIVNDIEFMVLGNLMHGAVFGLVISFLGIRYFISVRKLKGVVYKSSSKFSWDNFKKN